MQKGHACRPASPRGEQAGFTPILVLVGILVLITVTGGAFYLGNSLQKPIQSQNPVSTSAIPNPSPVAISQTPQPTHSPLPTQTAIPTNETANWKTYTNTKLGFSFKYPPEASVTESKPGEIHVRYTEQCFACQVNPGYGVSFDIKNLNLKNLKEVVEEEFERDKDSWRNLSSLSEIKVGSYSGYTYSIKSKVETKRIYLSHTTDDTYIQISYGSQYGNDKGDQKKIDQILSTFKFTGQGSVNPSPATSTENQFCGGIAGKPCPTGYECKLDGNYPDAGGKCIKQ